ncbi:uncharacterized protein LOC124450775 isoform X2 [Xenia sp. Carnegie-2017]|uniref:uncharacterized protein LOC124450775 isoform X2 n=1 Tax=Xenia sp. Carnegie-2017 TaxID=2897299 RepID=UPI001F046BD5|nr:uncharacterized protein LOC124450775 isoform X2 [Xenia sp. Carnegie-2017]
MTNENDAPEVEFEMKGTKYSSLKKLTGGSKDNTIGFRSYRENLRFLIAVFVAVILLIICIVLIALLVNKSSKNVSSSGETDSSIYVYSDEAQRIKLQDFLQRVQDTYYKYNSHWLSSKPDITTEELKRGHLPYNATPAYLKEKTDAALKLLDEINTKTIDENKMTPREVKALEQVKHFLKTVFGAPYDENFYNADWMLGPNHFCWQAICSIPYHIASYGRRVTPQSFEDAEKIIEKILSNRHSIFQFKSNMQLGVRTGMVRSKFNCIAGINAFKQIFKKISSKNNASEVVNEWFVDVYTKEKFIENLSTTDREKWMVTYKKDFTQSVKESLIEGIGKPVVDLVKYMENVHLRHCLPLNHASGLANLPVKYIYVDGKRTDNRTTRRFPITNTIIDGKKSYKDILAYFTTSDITPERVNEIGHERLNVLYPQVVEIAKNVTGLSHETAAITAFRKILANQKSYYNKKPFPEIESNATAHQRCTDIESARKFCPGRYKSLKAWIASCRKVMSMLAPKIINLFYHTGEWITVPNCPIEMEPSFNPSAGAQFFQRTAKSCTTPAKFGLPFFLENHGPRFSEWSVTAHESWPGHHTQIQSHIEYFKDPYGGLPKWLDDRTYYTFFTEGWGLYSENPVIAKDTDTYEEEPMQKFGMLKWQVQNKIIDSGYGELYV